MIAFLRDSKCCEYWIKGKNIEHCTKIEMTAVLRDSKCCEGQDSRRGHTSRSEHCNLVGRPLLIINYEFNAYKTLKVYHDPMHHKNVNLLNRCLHFKDKL